MLSEDAHGDDMKASEEGSAPRAAQRGTLATGLLSGWATGQCGADSRVGGDRWRLCVASQGLISDGSCIVLGALCSHQQCLSLY